MKWNANLRYGACLAAMTLTASFVSAQSAGVADPDVSLLPAEQVLEKHLEAAGGRENLEKMKGSVTKGKLQMPEVGIDTELVIYQKAPSSFAMEFEIPGAGKIRRGTNGDLAWEVSPLMGPRLIEGEEKTQFLKEADLHAALHHDKYYKSAETLEQVTLDDRPHYKVKMVTVNDKEEVRYFDAETFQVSKVEQTAVTPFGEIDIVVTLDDYREVGGLVIPFKVSQEVMGQTQVMAFDSIDLDSKVDDEWFAVPDEIQELTP